MSPGYVSSRARESFLLPTVGNSAKAGVTEHQSSFLPYFSHNALMHPLMTTQCWAHVAIPILPSPRSFFVKSYSCFQTALLSWLWSCQLLWEKNLNWTELNEMVIEDWAGVHGEQDGEVGIHLKEMKSISWRDICTTTFITALFTVAKIWK